MKLVIVLVVLQTLVSSTSATVYTVCTTSGSECDATTEDCDTTDLKCYCKTNFINKGDGTCVSDGCTTVTACSTNAIQNSKCNTGTNKCVCDALSDVSAAADATKGACVVKTCAGGGTECNGITNAKCSVTTGSGECVCTDTSELKDGACAAKVYGDSCTSDANCAGISATDAVCDASSNVCKIAVDKTCETTTDNCVTNGECDSTTTKCKCKANYVADTTGKLCVAENGVGIVAASLGALLITLLLQVSLL